jgi:hypothetical protein
MRRVWTGKRRIVHTRMPARAVGVPGVGVGDGEPEVALDPGQGGVAEPVGADLLGADPGQVPADADP